MRNFIYDDKNQISNMRYDEMSLFGFKKNKDKTSIRLPPIN